MFTSLLKLRKSAHPEDAEVMSDEEQPEGESSPGSKPQNADIRPAQIPLLEDIVDELARPAEAARKKKRENFSLDLDPPTPVNGELFSDADAPVDPRRRFQHRADELVEELVQTYSTEIISRLRTELNSLLDDLKFEDHEGTRDD